MVYNKILLVLSFSKSLLDKQSWEHFKLLKILDGMDEPKLWRTKDDQLAHMSVLNSLKKLKIKCGIWHIWISEKCGKES